MHLNSVEIEGLSGRLDCKLTFNRDLNLITGANGSGKTTLIKLIWYIISGNIERISTEIDFKRVNLSTSEYSITLESNKKIITWNFKSKDATDYGTYDATIDYQGIQGPELANQHVTAPPSSSVYFPTFRRIEGGYSMMNTRRIRRRLRPGGEITTEMVDNDEFQSKLDELSSRISVMGHRFVCSISTHDIVNLLTSRYTKVSEAINESYRHLSTSMISSIEGAKAEIASDNDKAYQLLTSLQNQAGEVNRKREALLKPFTVLSGLTAQIFRHKGIKVKGVTLGESVDAIDSGALSAGEKQMLSFLCYNAFYESSTIFIDEPELSLHPDWQRRLFPTLLGQQASNQFIVATHSPFIYSKYQDKELNISTDKGE